MMALKPERHIHQTTMAFTMNQAVEPGVVVVGSGASDGVATIAGGTSVGQSGVYPLGVVLNTRESFNYAKEYERFTYDTDDLGTVVSILQEGTVVTDQIVDSSVTPGAIAYLGQNGKVSAVNPAPASTTGQLDQSWRVGRFMTGKDSNGFATLFVQIQ